jgi:hypothetical protein
MTSRSHGTVPGPYGLSRRRLAHGTTTSRIQATKPTPTTTTYAESGAPHVRGSANKWIQVIQVIILLDTAHQPARV